MEVVQEYDCTSATSCTTTPVREFVWGDHARFPEPVAMVDHTGIGSANPSACTSGGATGGCVYHYLRDALGSVTALTDADGQAVERYTYDPYGKTLIEKWDSTANGGAGGWTVTNASSFGNPFAWTGQRYDAATATYHFWARTYSPYLGRWLQRDPAGYSGGFNLYGYCIGNPVYWYDPYGLGFWSSAKEVAYGVGEGVYNAGAGVASSVLHPIDTGTALGEAAYNQFQQFSDAGHSDASAYVGTGMVLAGQMIGAEGLYDAYEGKDHSGTNLSTQERASHGTTGAIQAGLTGSLIRAKLGPLNPKAKPPALPKAPPGAGAGTGAGEAAGGGTAAGEAGPPKPTPTNNCPKTRPGSVSGNPANRLVETGKPLKDGSGWVKKWTRMTAEEELAQDKAIAHRYSEVAEEASKLPPDRQGPYRFEKMREFREQYREDYLNNRK